MEDNSNDKTTINIITYINELMCQTQITQYYKNTDNNPEEIEVILPQLSEVKVTKFEVIKNNKKIISKLLEKEKAKEKYTDTITTGNSSLLSYNSEDDNESRVYLGNIPPGEEFVLKTYFFGHILRKDLSYQAKFPVIFPKFEISGNDYYIEKCIVKGKIYINTFSKITRLVIKGSKNFTKIEKIYGKDKKSAEINIFKEKFNDKDIPGIILFRTEKINDDMLYYQSDPKKKKSYYMLQKTLTFPKFNKTLNNDEIDEEENLDYTSMLIKEEEKNDDIKREKECFIFLLDESGSMYGERIDLSCKSLLLFLQSLDIYCYFQLIGFGSDFKYYSEKPLEYNKENIKNIMETIKRLSADRGSTDLYKPLESIYKNKIYKEYDMKKNIILLTDGEVEEKEKVINLIGSYSNEFFFNSIGIGNCDVDLVERTALIGNGYSFFINDLKELNSVIISLLEKTRYLKINKIDIGINKKSFIEENYTINNAKNDFFTYGFILDKTTIEDIELTIKEKDKEDIKLIFKKDKIIKLPDGDNLGKLIVDNYLKNDKSSNSNKRINLSKEFNILIKETAFYAEITNEVPVQENMIKITNKDKEIKNNTIEKNQSPQLSIDETKNNDYIYNDSHFGYEEEKIEEPEKKGFLKGLFSKLFSKDNIIRKKSIK